LAKKYVIYIIFFQFYFNFNFFIFQNLRLYHLEESYPSFESKFIQSLLIHYHKKLQNWVW